MGRLPLGARAMTAAERQQRHRSKARPAARRVLEPLPAGIAQQARAFVDALPAHERYNLALYLVCKLTARQREAFEIWHNGVFWNDG